MRRTALAFALLFCALLPAAASAAPARQPVVVELFTSQGCSSCAGADKLLDGLADRPGVLALTLAVDYWNYLGWVDTFARPEFTARQKAYMQKLALRDVYTPQIVVDGRAQAAATDVRKVDELIRKARREQGRVPYFHLLRHSRLRIGPGRSPRGGADVWLVRYDPSLQKVTVDKGENRGRTLEQRNVVRQLDRLGRWYGRTHTFTLPPAPKDGSLRTVALLQERGGGRILGVWQH
jgi:hypothetical protein